MDAAQREQAEARAVEVVADLLDDPARRDFPHHPVLLDSKELDWHIADRAFTLARQAGGAAPMFDRWRAKLPAARAGHNAEILRWHRGEVESVPLAHPPRGSSAERDRLARLEAPVVLVTTKHAAEAA